MFHIFTFPGALCSHILSTTSDDKIETPGPKGSRPRKVYSFMRYFTRIINLLQEIYLVRMKAALISLLAIPGPEMHG